MKPSPDLIQTLFIQAFLAIIQICVREVRIIAGPESDQVIKL